MKIINLAVIAALICTTACTSEKKYGREIYKTGEHSYAYHNTATDMWYYLYLSNTTNTSSTAVNTSTWVRGPAPSSMQGFTKASNQDEEELEEENLTPEENEGVAEEGSNEDNMSNDSADTSVDSGSDAGGDSGGGDSGGGGDGGGSGD